MPPYQSVKFVFSRHLRVPHPFLHQLKLATWDLKLETAFMLFIGNVIEKLQRHPNGWFFRKAKNAPPASRAASSVRCAWAPRSVLGDPVKSVRLAEKISLPLDGIRLLNPAGKRRSENLPNGSMRCAAKKPAHDRGARSVAAADFYGAMMLADCIRHGLISGAHTITGSVLAAAVPDYQVAPDIHAASSCMVMEVEETRIGEKGVLFHGRIAALFPIECGSAADISGFNGAACATLCSGRAPGAWRCYRFRQKRQRFRIQASARSRPPRASPDKAAQLFFGRGF